MKQFLAFDIVVGLLLAAAPSQPPKPPQAPPMPEEKSPKQSLSYFRARADSLETGKPLVVWVGTPSLPLANVVNLHSAKFDGCSSGIFVLLPHEGEMRFWRPLPVESSAREVQAEIDSLRSYLAPKVKVNVSVHSHTCPHCGKTFTHEDWNFGKVGPHMCPYCGWGPVWPIVSHGVRVEEVPAPTPTRQQSFAPRRATYCPT